MILPDNRVPLFGIMLLDAAPSALTAFFGVTTPSVVDFSKRRITLSRIPPDKALPAMAEERINRKLAAILAADVVGYSRLMGADEAGTLAALKRHRETIFDPAVAAHNGRIVKLIGDGTIVEFGSVVDAVNCALSVQRSNGRCAGRSARQPKIVLRIGINLGDVIIEGDDIYGDGVNIAARLEPLAEPGGICVSSIVNESVGNRIDVRFQDGGEISVKNIDRPIRVWKWHPGAAPPTTRQVQWRPSRCRTSATASIAVLPFTNMSGDPEQEYFSDGISEDIITDLSKIAGLMVIARNSSFTYKGRSVDIRTVGRELGVRSVLEGSIRRAGNRVRITAQLIDAGNRRASLGGPLRPRSDRHLRGPGRRHAADRRRARRSRSARPRKQRLADSETSNIDAYDCVLRGREFMLGKEKNRETFEQAIKYLQGGAGARSELFASLCVSRLRATCSTTRTAGPTIPTSRCTIAKEYARTGDRERSERTAAHDASRRWPHLLKRTSIGRKPRSTSRCQLNPSSGAGPQPSRHVRTYSGQPLEAIPEIEQAMRLDPAMSSQFLHFLGMAYLLAGKYETAAALLRQRIVLVPNTDFSRAILTSALGHLGEIEEARRVWAELMEINPKYSFFAHVGRQPFKRPEDVERIAEGLRKAGVLS